MKVSSAEDRSTRTFFKAPTSFGAGGLRLTVFKILPALLVALALAVPVAAEDVCYTTSETSDEMIVVATPFLLGVPTWYAATDLCQDDPQEPDPDPEDPYNNGRGPCILSIWTYEESNGLPGLQRSDERVDDMAGCPDGMAGDTLSPY